MRFGLLGPVALYRETGGSITPSALKHRELLALLMLNANHVVVTDHLIEQLWNAAPPRTARTALQVYVSRLRGHLTRHQEGQRGQGAYPRLVTESSGYALVLEGDELDATQFEALRRRAAIAEGAGDLTRAAALLGQALELWRGPALADVRGLPEIAAGAERLNEDRILAQEYRIALELRLDRHQDALPRLTELVTQHPLREGLYGHLMLAQYRCGRTVEALATYMRIRSLLVSEIGLEPGANLRSLHQAILNRDPALETSDALAS
ncbi:AfsR/SARP family transcriptional regulator [Streptomyces mayteni]